MQIKKTKYFIMLIIIPIMLAGACSSLDGIGMYSGSPSGGRDSYISSGELGDKADDTSQNGDVAIAAGQLTAAEWNDNKNYDFWQTLFMPDSNQQKGAFEDFKSIINFYSLSRIVLNITAQSSPAVNARAELYHNGEKLYTAISDMTGKAYLFTNDLQEGAELDLTVIYGATQLNSKIDYVQGGQTVEIELNSQSVTPQNKLELMFVVDTTGSMGDELEYLKSEIKDVVDRVKLANPQLDISIALLFYRDKGDEYVTRYFDFTTEIEVQKQNISRQSANGGGDFEEAVHTALTEAAAKQWSSNSTARLILHILDAPPHLEDYQQYSTAVFNLASQGVRLIPVASSGIDKTTEYLLRNQAMLTGGTYVFLTDDSGIGGSHLPPSTGEYVVEYLNALLVRVINEYCSGVAQEPVPYRESQ